jgi:hypothetical protein
MRLQRTGRRRAFGPLVPSLMAALAGCGALTGSAIGVLASCGTDDPPAGSSFSSAPDSAVSSSGSSGFQTASGGTPDAEVPFCVATQAEAAPGTRPVDIILVVDNSSSMSEEIGEIEDQIIDSMQ